MHRGVCVRKVLDDNGIDEGRECCCRTLVGVSVAFKRICGAQRMPRVGSFASDRVHHRGGELRSQKHIVMSRTNPGDEVSDPSVGPFTFPGTENLGQNLGFETSESVSVVSNFDGLNLKEDLLRGIYAYS